MINVTGSVDCPCFDKTGKITEDGMDMWGGMVRLRVIILILEIYMLDTNTAQELLERQMNRSVTESSDSICVLNSHIFQRYQ